MTINSELTTHLRMKWNNFTNFLLLLNRKALNAQTDCLDVYEAPDMT